MRINQISDYFYRDVQPFFKGSFDDEFLSKLSSTAVTSLDFSSSNIQTAFIHRSFKNENSIALDHNEKLEFLGDSVLQMYISELLFMNFPNKREGELSKMRSALVNEDSLCLLALLCQLDRSILLGKGELKEKGFQKKSILADCFEAVLGARYLDGGASAAYSYLDEVLALFEQKSHRPFISEALIDDYDAKSKLQELVMKKYKVHPEYLCDEVTQNDKKIFQIQLSIEGKIIDTTLWPSKKKGMQVLAKKVLAQNLI